MRCEANTRCHNKLKYSKYKMRPLPAMLLDMAGVSRREEREEGLSPMSRETFGGGGGLGER